MNSFLVKIENKDGKNLFRQFNTEKLTIGSSPFSSIHLPLEDHTGIHSLMQYKDKKFVITRLNMNSSLKIDGKEVETGEITHDNVISIDQYKLSIVNPMTIKPKKKFCDTYQSIGRIETKSEDNKLWVSFFIAFLLLLITLTTISLIELPQEIPLDDISDRFSRLVIDPVSIKNPLAKPIFSGDGEGEGVRAAGKEGERGSTQGKFKAKGLRQIVKTKGVLGALSNKVVRKQLASILEDGMGFGKKFSAALNRSGGKASKTALYKGTFGTGMKGVGPGGGGQSVDVVGGLSTKGKGGGLVGYGQGSVGQRQASSIIIDEVNTIVKGSLERKEIEKVIKRHLPQIRYCYERELKLNPELNGKVVSFFVIGGDGNVTSANIKESTMKNAAVETCISRRIAKWIFPKPRGGGIVVVKYPFIFRNMK